MTLLYLFNNSGYILLSQLKAICCPENYRILLIFLNNVNYTSNWSSFIAKWSAHFRKDPRGFHQCLWCKGAYCPPSKKQAPENAGNHGFSRATVSIFLSAERLSRCGPSWWHWCQKLVFGPDVWGNLSTGFLLLFEKVSYGGTGHY